MKTRGNSLSVYFTTLFKELCTMNNNIFIKSLTTNTKMRKSQLALCLIASLMATIAMADETDNRQILELSAPQRNYVLGEMRSLLAGTKDILSALAKDDMTAVAEHAKALGFGMQHKAENPLHAVLPKAFMQLGMSMHQDFDLIAEEAVSLKNAKHTLQQLSTTMAKCNACHATYQIRDHLTDNAVPKASATRLDEVTERGSQVMPFNLAQTTHVFSKTEKGGVQQVIVKDTNNTEQIKLIRGHLSKICHEFKQGDFSGPAKIHGETMPGLEELRQAKPNEIAMVYQALPNGAEIDYSTENPVLIQALHRWFDAQLSDHARHAISGHANHQMHK
jgi:hypothetical protein